MKVIIPGHKYELQNLNSETTSELQFYCDPEINGIALDGPSCQEVIRALIDRVQELDRQKPYEGNAKIIKHLRFALAEFEVRALLRKVEKGLPIENIPTGRDGHIV